MVKLNFILTLLLIIGGILLLVGISCNNVTLVNCGILGSLATYCVCQLVRFMQELTHQYEDKGE